jgi:hypothetical protein
MAPVKSINKDDLDDILKVNAHAIELKLQTTSQFEEIIETIDESIDKQNDLVNAMTIVRERQNVIDTKIIDHIDSDDKFAQEIKSGLKDAETTMVMFQKDFSQYKENQTREHKDTNEALDKVSSNLKEIREKDLKDIKDYMFKLTIILSSGILGLLYEIFKTYIAK